MKRYVCTVAAGLLLGLVSTGTATAGGLPDLGQTATQVTSFGDQTVGKQSNDADVTQAQGNGNVNIAPAIALFGDAETTNEQGNGNTATANVDQSNSVDQSQSSTQKQSLEQSGGTCCDGQSQAAGEQETSFGAQVLGKQKNAADIRQWQGNGDANVAPAIALFGNAKTANHQGNANDADATVTQSNDVSQSQSSRQSQLLEQSDDGCCEADEYKPPCSPEKEGGQPSKSCETRKHSVPKGDSCCDGQSQAGEQRTSFGDQVVGKQRNEADVTQKQGNGNVNVSPALALAGGKHESCRSKCKGSWKPSGGKARTTNEQGSGNTATADVDQSNSVEQSQTSSQRQSIVDECKGLVHR